MSVELLAYSCLAFGTLTGKYLNGAKPQARGILFSRFTRYSGEQAQKPLPPTSISRRHEILIRRRWLAFVRRQPFVAPVRYWAQPMAQLQTNVESLHLTLSEDVLAEIEAAHQVYTYRRRDGQCPVALRFRAYRIIAG